ncbi:unnamed protein product [Didymodactylos carnosus]|uniref:NHL repeat containing protein n=1 Tax=Didymodactylos carnosus TaxID=1234261 RepID=A0A814YEZ2_9BILA|nr:unnamed protein product [Didymodactylos carnosus]CAF1229447.1 unnamed protein product [Didymodactylos carnosus]CAF3972385.1 unnamed protein product [Didymodactylos carnosus]CAF3992165.1 unnamed protein product [Didymodactylos carnosus]
MIVTLVSNAYITAVFIDRLDNIYFVNQNNNSVQKLSTTNGLLTIVAGGNIVNGPHGFALNELNNPLGLYVDRSSTVYVSDTYNNRVMKWLANAKIGSVVAGGGIYTSVGVGRALNQLNLPVGIFVDEINEIGALYICDSNNYRIQKWLSGASAGITVADGTGGALLNQISQPWSIIVDTNSIMYITDRDMGMYGNGNRVMKWLSNARQGQVTAGTQYGVGAGSNLLHSPQGIKFDSSWNLYVADWYNHRVQKFIFNKSVNTSC